MDITVYTDLGRYGAGRVMATIASGLADRGHCVDVVTSSPEADKHPLLDRRWTLTVLNRHGASLAYLLWRRFREHGADAILLADHRFAIMPTIVARLARPSARRIIVLHCDPESLLRGGRHMNLGRLVLWRIYLHLGFRSATMLVAVSDGVRRRALQWLRLAAHKIVTIYNPVLFEGLIQAATEPSPHPWLRDSARPVVLAVGRLSHEKDWGTVLRAFGLVRAQVPARLIILGDGPERTNLTRLVHALGLTGDVTLAGEVRNPYAYMSKAAVLAHSAVTEGLGNVIIEASYLGLPVVAANCPVGPAEILEGGKWGTLVPARDPSAMAEALLDAISTHSHPPGASSAMWTRFSVDAAILAYEGALVGARPNPSHDGRPPSRRSAPPASTRPRTHTSPRSPSNLPSPPAPELPPDRTTLGTALPPGSHRAALYGIAAPPLNTPGSSRTLAGARRKT